jgi:hypothetical protein
MLPGYRPSPPSALLLLLIVGCAPSLLVVPDSDWQKVPPAERAAIDRQHEASVAAARAELRTANAGLAEAQRPPSAPTARGPGASAKPDPDADAWAVALHDHDQQRIAAHTRVETARADWQRTRLIWRQRQVDAASARVDLQVSDRELTRARAIDHSLPGSDHYDSAPLQGQFSRAQKRWHTAAMAARQARVEFERASTTLASAKEAYAQLMRNGPARLELALPSDGDERPRLELTGWTISRSDIARRRGLRHWLDVAASGAPQLRKKEFRLRPAPRTPPSETPRAASPAVAPAPAAPPAPETTPPPAPVAAPAPAPKPPVTSAAPPTAKPWDFIEPRRPARVVAAARAVPAPPTRKPAAPSPKPWDFVEPARPGP